MPGFFFFMYVGILQNLWYVEAVLISSSKSVNKKKMQKYSAIYWIDCMLYHSICYLAKATIVYIYVFVCVQYLYQFLHIHCVYFNNIAFIAFDHYQFQTIKGGTQLYTVCLAITFKQFWSFSSFSPFAFHMEMNAFSIWWFYW